MSEKIDDGGPAFPSCIYETEHGDRIYALGGDRGMTLRDYFAAAALQAILVNNSIAKNSTFDDAYFAYEMADAMLKARSK